MHDEEVGGSGNRNRIGGDATWIAQQNIILILLPEGSGFKRADFRLVDRHNRRPLLPIIITDCYRRTLFFRHKNPERSPADWT